MKDDAGTADQSEPFGPLVHAAEATLADVLGHPIRFANSDSHNLADAGAWDRQRFLSDWAGSQFLSGLGSAAQHSPQFYGGNRDLGFIVLEDLGHHRSLIDPLLHEAAASAEKALFRYSACLGKLLADTIGKLPTLTIGELPASASASWAGWKRS